MLQLLWQRELKFSLEEFVLAGYSEHKRKEMAGARGKKHVEGCGSKRQTRDG